MDERDTIPAGPPDGCREHERLQDMYQRLMQAAPGGGARRETTAQRDARERGERRFNAYGCK